MTGADLMAIIALFGVFFLTVFGWAMQHAFYLAKPVLISRVKFKPHVNIYALENEVFAPISDAVREGEARAERDWYVSDPVSWSKFPWWERSTESVREYARENGIVLGPFAGREDLVRAIEAQERDDWEHCEGDT